MTNCPIPNATGHMEPEGSGANGVLLLGEAMGEQEVDDSLPFRPHAPAGSVLERGIRRLGMNRESFVVWNVVPVRPPNNWLEGAPWEHDAVEWGRPMLETVIDRFKPRAIVALGSVATRAVTGLAGDKLGISQLTGFILPTRYNIPCIPTFHPSYLRRGKMSHLGVMMNVIRKAVIVARDRIQAINPPVDAPPPGYLLYPTRDTAYNFLEQARSAQRIAYDIETPYSTAEEEAEEHAGNILSIQFSLAPKTGIFLPWRSPFIDVAREVLALQIPKLSWNGWRFDDPTLRAEGLSINSDNHDLMWAWHHLNPDIPRGLQFAAAQLGWPWPWKHLDRANPQFYGIVDVDVLQWMVRPNA